MPRNRAFLVALGLATAAVTVPALVSCLSDPREEDKDVPTPQCDANNYKTLLSSDPASAESSLRNYVQASLELKAQTDEVEQQLIAACNALVLEPMVPPFADTAPGQDVKAACKRIADRVDGINATAPAPNPPNAAAGQVRAAPSCTTPAGALETCLATCGAQACTPGKCAPEQRSQKCDGTCNGKCQTSGDKVACNPGTCIGTAATDVTATPPVVQVTCAGQCDGLCSSQVWQGKCEGACSGQFAGFCAGTCTGACITDPTNPRGTPANPEALGDGGTLPPLTVVPTGHDGNCLGLCSGVCSSGADGFCQGLPCFIPPVADPDLSKLHLGKFNGTCVIAGGGSCLDPALIPGNTPGATCVSAEGTGVAGTCSGTCETVAAGSKCDGRCVGECQGNATDVTCSAAPNCGQNAECTNACSALVALQTSTACTESQSFEAFALHDPALLEAWKKYGKQFSKPVQRILQLRSALSFIGQRAYGNFVAIGLKGQYIRSCVEFGAQNAAAANDKLQVMSAVNPTAKR